MIQQLALNVGLSDRAHFDNYFAGANVEAVSAVRDFATAGAGLVVLYGAEGCGKTHLLYAAQKCSIDAGRRASYLPMSDPAAADGLAGLDDPDALVCVDDAERAAGAKRLERALFNLIERLRQGRGGLLLGCLRHPSQCGFRMADLLSRLAGGAAYRLTALSDVDKAAAMRLRAADRGFYLSDEVIAYVMNRFPRDTSALFALLDRIDRYSLSEQRKVTVPLIRKLEAG